MNALVNEKIPLKKDRHGVIRIADTRVTLETIISAFRDGETAEEIVLSYPTLALADVYSVIGYYLHQKSEVEEYISHQTKKSAEVRLQNETRFNQIGIRERLLARKR